MTDRITDPAESKVIVPTTELIVLINDPAQFIHNLHSVDKKPVSAAIAFLRDYGAVYLGGDVAANNFYFGNKGYKEINLYQPGNRHGKLIEDLIRLSKIGEIPAKLRDREFFIESADSRIRKELGEENCYDLIPVQSAFERFSGVAADIHLYLCSEDKFNPK